MEPEPALGYIAKKWFGFEETDHHRILVENPLFYLTARARLIEHPKLGKRAEFKTNKKHLVKPLAVTAPHFHFIVVDLCYGFGSENVGKCPLNEFMEEKVVRELSQNLAKNGE